MTDTHSSSTPPNIPQPSLQARMLAAKATDPALMAEFAALPLREMLDIALVFADRFSQQCDEWVDAVIEANIPTDISSQNETTELLARLKATPA
jgi:hypothetical protein